MVRQSIFIDKKHGTIKMSFLCKIKEKKQCNSSKNPNRLGAQNDPKIQAKEKRFKNRQSNFEEGQCGKLIWPDIKTSAIIKDFYKSIKSYRK